MIIERRELVIDSFTQVPNRLIRDRDLSPKARLLWMWMASHEVGWQTSTKQLSEALGIGVGATRAAAQELIDAGWLHRTQGRQQRGQFGGSQYTLCEPASTGLSTGSGEVTHREPETEPRPSETPGHNREPVFRARLTVARSAGSRKSTPIRRPIKEHQGGYVSREPHQRTRELSPYCEDHPNGTARRCPACGEARQRAEDARRTALAEQRAASAAQRADCTECDDAGWLLGEDHLPVEPAQKCGHGPQLRVVSGG